MLKLSLLKETIQRLKAELKSQVPHSENPNIERLSGGAFAMNIKDLSRKGVLSADHYDFPYQARMLEEEIDRTEPENMEEKITRILTEEKIRVNSNYTLVLHPEFARMCREAFGVTEKG